ncbi:MAG TPA: adenylate/guanylate cyclase domain-containing protein, partial [Acidimicrobiales bacterium]|nr:adenylate/guanylate cyclase domain-containing protein [Acidimicrobiales bacterium]
PVDLVVVSELISHSEHRWDEPKLARSLRRLASFSRLIQFDRRGTGLSDPVPIDRLPTLEQRMDDLTAVLDAAGAQRPVLVGFGEGGVESILYAATHPERVSSLVLYGAWPRFIANDEYPTGWHRDTIEPLIEGILAVWGQGGLVPHVAPSMVGDERFGRWLATFERVAASPGTASALMRIALTVDIRHVLPAVRVPTLVIHRIDDRFSPVGHGRFIADHILDAKLVELPGADHPFFVGDADAVIDEIEAFVTGTRPIPQVDRVLATVLFADIVGSTELVVTLGDAGWRDLLEAYLATARRQLERFDGKEIDTAGDGLFASFDGPARAVRCASAIRDAARALGLEVRAGLHTGESEVIAGKIGGVTVHVAARVAALAEPGEVLVSRTIKDLVAGSGIRFEHRGTHALKGLRETWALFRADV